HAQVADVVKASPEEIVFTASGSEGANLAIKGAALAEGRDHLVSTRIEHHGVLETCRWLAKQHGFELTLVDVDQYGQIDLEQLAAAVSERTALVSVGYANNE